MKEIFVVRILSGFDNRRFINSGSRTVLLSVAAALMWLFPVSSDAQITPVSPHVSAINPFSFILLELGLIVIVAFAAQILSGIYRLPLVVGELVTGLVVGNLLYWMDWSPLFFLVMHLGDSGELFKLVWSSGMSVSDAASRVLDLSMSAEAVDHARFLAAISTKQTPEFVVMVIALWIFSNFGVFVLLFKIGLETRLEDLIHSRPVAYGIALTGVFVPFVLGMLAGFIFLPESSFGVRVFLGATLCTTSAALSAQLLSRIKGHETERSLVNNTAWIDDVFSIFLLAVLMGIALHNKAGIGEITGLISIGIVFVATVVLLSRCFSSHISDLAAFDHPHVRVIVPLALIFILSWVAEVLELGVVAGAFTAGLVLNEKPGAQFDLRALVGPLEVFFVPVFFVFVGMQVNLNLFFQADIVLLTLFLVIAAVAGKLSAVLMLPRGLNRLVVGAGLIPRGEAVLIFISVGKIIGFISDSLFSVIVMMVILTNLVAAILLRRIEPEITRGMRPPGS